MLGPKDRRSARPLGLRDSQHAKWLKERKRRLSHLLAFDGLEDRTLLSGGNINFQTVGQDLAADLSAIQTSVNAGYQTATVIPIIGNDLQNNTTIKNLITQFNTVATQLESLGTQTNNAALATLVQNQLFSALGPAGTGWLADINNQNNGSVQANDVLVTPNSDSDGTLTVEMLLTANAPTTTVNFNLGLPSFLGFSSANNVKVDLTTDYLLEFTFDPTSNVLALVNTNLQATQATALHDTKLPPNPFAITVTAKPATSGIGSAQLDNFLLATVTDNGTQLTGTFGIGIDGNNGATINFSGDASVDLSLSLSFGAGNVPLDPTLTTGINFDWGFSTYAAIDTATPKSFGTIPDIEFTGVQLSTQLGTVGQIISDIQDYTKPLQPIINTLNDNIPGLSSLGINVSLLSLLLNLSGEQGEKTLITTFFNAITEVNAINVPTSGSITLPVINSFEISDPRQGSPTVEGQVNATDSATLDHDVNIDTGTSLASVENVSANYGLHFPIFDDPVGTIVPLLLGNDVSLFTFTLPPVSIPVDTIKIPIGSIPPFIPVIQLDIGVELDLDFSAGYDTAGLRELVADELASSGSAIASQVSSDIFHGFYVDDTNTYIKVKGNFDLEIDAYIVSVTGGVYADLGIAPKPDGNPNDASAHKSRLDYLIDSVEAGGGIFSVFSPEGSIGLDFSINVGLELGIVDVTVFSIEIGPIPLVTFSASTPPTQSTAPTIVVNETDSAEKIHVHQVTYQDSSNASLIDSAIEVDSPGNTQLYPTGQFSENSSGALVPVVPNPFPQYSQVVTKASGTIDQPQTIVVGNLVSYDANGNPVPVNAVLIGGSGDDDLEYTGAGQALLIGDGGNNTLVANNSAASAIEYGNTIDPSTSSPLTGATEPGWIDKLPPDVQAEIAAEMVAASDTTTVDALTGPGGDDFLEGGAGTNTFQESGSNFTLVGAGQVANTYAITEATGQGPAPSGAVYASGPQNVLLLKRTSTSDTLSVTPAKSVTQQTYLELSGTQTNIAVFGSIEDLAFNLNGGSLDLGDLSSEPTLESIFIVENQGSGANTITLESSLTAKPSALTVGSETITQNSGTDGASQALTPVSALTETNPATNANVVFQGLTAADLVDIKLNGGTASLADLDNLGPETINLDALARAVSSPPGNTIVIQCGTGDALNMTNDGSGGAEIADGTAGVKVDILGSESVDSTTVDLGAAQASGQPVVADSFTIDASSLAGALTIDGNLGLYKPGFVPVAESFVVDAVGPKLSLAINAGAGVNTFDVIHGGSNNNITINGGSGSNTLILERKVSSSAVPDQLSLAPTPNPGAAGQSLEVTGTGTSITAYNTLNIQVDMYGGTLDVHDLGSLGASVITVGGLASPAQDPNHIIIEAPDNGIADNLTVGAGIAITDSATNANYAITGLVSQDDVRIKLNGGGTETVNNIDQLGPYTIELDSRARLTGTAQAPNDITFVGPYRSAPNPGGVPIPLGLKLAIATSASGDPYVQDQDATTTGPIIIEGSVAQDTTNVSLPVPWFSYGIFNGNGNLPGSPNSFSIDASALEGAINVTTPFVTGPNPGYLQYSFYPTNVTISALNVAASLTYTGFDPSPLAGYAPLTIGSRLGESYVAFGTGSLATIQGRSAIHNAFVTVNNAAATVPEVLALSASSLSGWDALSSGASPSLTFNPLSFETDYLKLGSLLPFVIDAGASDAFNVTGTPALPYRSSGDYPDTDVLIQNTATSATPNLVAVSGTDVSDSLVVQGDFALAVGRVLNSDGSVSAKGDILGIAGPIDLDYEGPGTTSLVLDASNDTFNDVGSNGIEANADGTDYFNFNYYGDIGSTNPPPITFNGTGVDVTIDGMKSSGTPNLWFFNPGLADPITFQAAAASGGVASADNLSFSAGTASLLVEGNGATVVNISGKGSGSVLYAAGVTVNDAASLTFSDSAGPVPSSTVVLDATSLSGLTGLPLIFSQLGALTIDLPVAPTLTVNNTPAGTQTSLKLVGSALTVMATTGPLSIESTTLNRSSVVIGSGTLSSLAGQIVVTDDFDNGTPVTVDDRSGAAASNASLMYDSAAFSYGVFGLAPVTIDVPSDVTVYGGAGSTYSVSNLPTSGGPTLYAGKGSSVTVSLGSAQILGAAQVSVSPLGTAGSLSVEPDPARATDRTNLSLNITSLYVPYTLADDPSGDLALSIADGENVLYNGTSTMLTVTTSAVTSLITVDDSGAAGTILDGVTNVAVAKTSGPLTLNVEGYYGSTVTIGSGGSVAAIQGEVDVDGPTSGNLPQVALKVDDSSDATGRTFSVTTGSDGTQSVTGLAAAPIRFLALSPSAQVPSTLTVDGGSGGNTITLVDTSAGTPITLNAGAGNDAINVLVSGTGGFAALSVDGQGGTNTLSAAGQTDSPTVYNVPSATTPGSGTLQAIYPAPGPTRTINYANISSIAGTLYDTTTTLTIAGASSGTVYYGEPFTLTATVADIAKVANSPGGLVTFINQSTGTTLGTASLVNGVATISSYLSLETSKDYSVIAQYQGDAADAPSNSAPIVLYLADASTATTIAASANPVTAAQPVTFTATVTETAPGKLTPTGRIEFVYKGIPVGLTQLSAQGTASYTVDYPAAGSFTIYAYYEGDADNQASASSTLTETVNANSTTTTLSSSLNPVAPNQSFNLVATVTSSGPIFPSGLVTFYNGTTALGTAYPGAGGVASLPVGLPTIGSYSLTASYAGDAYDASSTSAVLLESVGLRASVTTIAGMNVGDVGQPIDVEADVAPVSGSGTPTGSVTFFDGTTALGTITLNAAGIATLTNNPLAYGDHQITAVYSGDSIFGTSTSQSFDLKIADISLTLAPVLKTAVYGQPIPIETTFAGLLPGYSDVGYVSYYDGNTLLSEVYTNGSTDFYVSANDLSVGTHQITAYFGGNGAYPQVSATSPPVTIIADATATALAVSPSSSIIGQSVTLTATVTAQQPGSGMPTGTVTFFDGKNPIDTESLDDTGTATLSTTALGLGAHDLTAVYNGDVNFSSSTSPDSFEKVINSISVSVALSASTLTTTEAGPVTFTATVTPSDTSFGIPTGKVNFLDGGNLLGSEVLVDGTATFTTTLPNGVHHVTAAFFPTTDFSSGTSDPLAILIRPNYVSSTITSTTDPDVSASKSVIVDASGDLFGVTPTGGDYGLGFAYEVPHDSGTVEILASFYDSSASSANALVVDPSGDLFGTSAQGGDGSGSIFEISAGSGYVSILYNFDQLGDESPSGSLAIDASGDIFGTTMTGGDFGAGAIYELTNVGGGLSLANIASFQDGVTGAGPLSGLVADAAGNLYGTTSSTSADNGGTVYELINQGDGTFSGITTLATFDGVNQNSATGLVVDAGGDVFGVTAGDGPSGDGTVFEVAGGSGVVTTLATFNGSNGSQPNPALALDAAGDLFGTTSSGGLLNGGTAFEIVAGTATLSTIETFGTPKSDFVNPAFGLAGDSAGNLFGVTIPESGAGPITVFQLTSTDQSTTVTVTSDVPAPVSGQTVDLTATLSAGDATGTVTFTDGTTILGFAPVLNGVATISPTFLAGKHPITAVYSGDTSNPQAAGGLESLVAPDTASLICNVTFNTSTVYLGEPGNLLVVVLPASPGSGTPTGSITLSDNGKLIGTPELVNGEYEMAYTPLTAGPHQIQVNYSGDSEFLSGAQAESDFDVSSLVGTTLALTSSATAVSPGQPITLTATVAPALDADGVPTGNISFFDRGTLLASVPLSATGTASFATTLATGYSDLTAAYQPASTWGPSTSNAVGVIMSAYTPQSIAPFTGANGQYPIGTPSLDQAGNLYGVTVYGGDVGGGTIFELARGASETTTLATFDGENGYYPSGSLVIDAQGDLFGTTSQGGAYGNGTVFELIQGSGTISVLASFTNPADGASPAPLAMDAAGNLFGVSPSGGDSGYGSVFEVPVGSGLVVTIASFEAVNGSLPNGVTLDSAGDLYGTTLTGGTNGEGTVFEIAAGSQEITTIVTFDGDNGSYPEAGLSADAHGDFFGTTSSGGAGGHGTLFEITPGANTFTSVASFQADDIEVPFGPLAFDPQGDVFGLASIITDEPFGGAFEVVNGSGVVTTIAALPLPVYSSGGLVRDAAGDLFALSSFAQNGLGALVEIVPALPATSVILNSNTTTPVFGQAVTLSATLSIPSATGSVTFLDGSTTLGVADLKAGTAVLPGLELATTVHTITAVYSGDSADGPGTSATLTITVSPAATSVSVAASANPANVGQAVTFTATVSAIAPGTGTPTGTVQFVVDNADVGAPVKLVNGIASSAAIKTLAAGPHTVSVVYANADGNYTGTTGALGGGLTVVTPWTITSIGAPAPDARNSAVDGVVVTFSTTINISSFSTMALSLTDNGQGVSITTAPTLKLISGTTYELSGLATETTAQGLYSLTISAGALEDQTGLFGSGSLSTSWLMDTTSPTSVVSALPTRETSVTFPVSVTGSDGGNPPAGVASYDIYASINGGAWKFWTNALASSPPATFSGQSNTTYAFYSIAHDAAGNIEPKSPVIEASTYVPNLTAPVTSVNPTKGTNPSSVNSATGTFTLNLTGNDPGGGVLTYFEVFVSVDSGPYAMVNGAAIPAGPADSTATVHASIPYQGLTDGAPHTYAFFSIGMDGAGNVQSAPAAPNLSISETFAQPTALQVTSLVVEDGAVERSYIRYLGIDFNESDTQSSGQLSQIVSSLGSSTPDLLLFKYDLNGTAASKTPVSLAAVNLAVIDHAIELDFGAGGVGGAPSTIAADGYYELDIKLPTGAIAVHHFYRLLGDVTGDGVVDSNDLNAIAAANSLSSPSGMAPLDADVNGDGSVMTIDLTLTTRSKNRKLGPGLALG